MINAIIVMTDGTYSLNEIQKGYECTDKIVGIGWQSGGCFRPQHARRDFSLIGGNEFDICNFRLTWLSSREIPCLA